MSLDVNLEVDGSSCYESNITHNLCHMARAAGIYMHLWRPEELKITKAEQLIEPLRAGVAWLEANEAEARKYDSPNEWGMYEHFLPFVRDYLAACELTPTARVSVWR